MVQLHMIVVLFVFWCEFAVAGYARSQGKTPVCFGPMGLVSCRTSQGHTRKDYFLRTWRKRETEKSFKGKRRWELDVFHGASCFVCVYTQIWRFYSKTVYYL